MTHKIDVLNAKNSSCLSRCVRDRIVVVKSYSFSAVGFPDFLDKWFCTTQNWLFCVVLVVRLKHVQFFPNKQAIICLEVLRERATFNGFGSSWNTHTVDYCLLSGSWFWTTFTKFVLEWTATAVEFIIKSITLVLDGASSPKIELSSLMHCCWVNPGRKL